MTLSPSERGRLGGLKGGSNGGKAKGKAKTRPREHYIEMARLSHQKRKQIKESKS